ncbi:hypothetical protein [Deinococcus hohokamensis]|uniref:PEGA domain-containing protein n=1 Tax=Deinococcus hohokamensis TaxID=309883 RepID=A0ABV9I9C5_9DEIO
MKPIGPYVAARELPGPAGAVRTLRATDRLTGMPVLLHLLPRPVTLPALPDHPALLPPTDAGFDGDQAYVATELPPHAQAASDPLLAAQGALAALAALHGAGLVHGGVAPAQLWSLDGEVRLAGAGLPWRAQGASPEADLRDLADALEALGGLPRPLQALRGGPHEAQITAQAALDRLARGHSGPGSEDSGPTGHAGAFVPEVPPHDGSPIVLGDLPEVAQDPAPATPPEDTRARPQTVVIQAVPQTAALASAGAPTSAPVPGASPAPFSTSGRETPQERRRRENEARRAQAILDAQAGARRKAERLRAQAEQAEAAPAVPTPIRIGFAEAEAEPDDLPPWPEGPAAAETAPRLQLRTVERLPASLRRSAAPDTTAAPDTAEDPPAESHSARATEPGRLPARHVVHQPIRIGWDEDDSWRVVREPEAPSAPHRARRPRWVLPLVAALVLLGLGLWASRSLGAPQAVPTASSGAAAPATPCCDVRFALQGSQAKVVVLSAPEDANLTPGQTLGHAPGVIHFPLQGRYRLRVEADGYGPAVLNLSVPRNRPVEIALGP